MDINEQDREVFNMYENGESILAVAQSVASYDHFDRRKMNPVLYDALRTLHLAAGDVWDIIDELRDAIKEEK